MDKPVADLFALAAIDEFLFHSTQLREFRQNRSAALSGEQIGGVPNGRIRRNAGEAVRPSTFQTHAQIGEGSGTTLSLVRFGQPEKSLPECIQHHHRLRAAALLLEDEQWLIKLGTAPVNLLAQVRDLCDPEADALRYANTRSFDSATLCSASARPAQDDKSVSIDHPRNPRRDGSTAASDESWLPQDSAFERLNHYEAGQQVGEQEWKMRSV